MCTSYSFLLQGPYPFPLHQKYFGWIASSEAGSPLNSKVSVFINYYSKIELGLRNPSYNFMEKFKANFGDACVDEIFFKKK